MAIEGGIAALIAAALSLPVTAWLFAGLSTFQLPGGVNLELLELSVNVRVVTAAAAVAIIATLIVGGIAAAFGFAGPVAELLRMRAGSTPPLNRRRTHRLSVSAQVAMALVLLGGAGLFARSLSNALELNPAFDTDRILTSTISLSSPGVPMSAPTSFSPNWCSGCRPTVRSRRLERACFGDRWDRRER